MYTLTDEDKRKLIYSIDEKNITEIDEKIIRFIADIDKKNVTPKPSKITISTCSYTGELNFIIDDFELLKNMLIKEKENGSTFIKDVNLNKKKKKESKRKYNSDFYNSICIDLKYNKCNIHFKLFLNGKITGTGCKTENDLKFIYVFIDLIKKNEEIRKNVKIKTNENELLCKSIKITMINSKFSSNFKINKTILIKVLIDKYKKNIQSNTNYQGIKINYFYNKNNKLKNGECLCEEKCKIEKKFRKNNKCKLITIALFHKGNHLITGGDSIDKIEEAYNYINNILIENYDQILLRSILDY